MECRCVKNPGIIPGQSLEQLWRLPIPAYLIEKAVIIYEQLGEEKLRREITAEAEGLRSCILRLRLEQADTLALRQLIPVSAQINLLSPSGERVASQIVVLPVGAQMMEEEMSL